jgi:hypothetical protein
LLLSRRAAVASLILVVSAVMAFFALSLRIDPGVEALVPAGGRDLALLREFNEKFGSDEILVLALHAEPLFTAEDLALMEDLTRRAERLPHVKRVLSPVNLRDIDGDELGPFSASPYEKVLSGEMSPEELGRRLAAHPIYSALLVSRDAMSAALLIDVERIEGDDQYRSVLVSQVRALAADAARSGSGRGLDAYVAGIPVEKVDVAAFVERDQLIFAPIIFLMLAAVTAYLYRHPVGVAVPLSVVALSLLWTLGLCGMAGRSLNPVTALITPVVLVISVAEAIHLLNHHLAGRAEGLDRVAALERAFARARVPCFNAALTTAIGFGSLMLLPIPATRDFGLFTAAGVMISYAQTMVLGPLLLGWLPDFPGRVIRAFRPGPIERAMKRGASWVCRHPVMASAGAALVLTVSAIGVTRIRVETDIIRSLRPSSALRQATTFIDTHLTGVDSLEIMVRGVDPGDPVGLAALWRFEEEVRGLPGVRKVSALPDLYARVNRAFHQGDDRFARLPEGPEAAADLADIRELLDREAAAELSRFAWRPGEGARDRPILRVAARVTATDTASSQALFGRIREAASRAGLGEVDLTGSFAVLSNMSTTLVSNQIRGLAPALALILAAMAVQFGSIRLGLLSAIPNGAPVLMVYGLMGWTGIALSVPTAMIASIAVGMTVDNTIHLMARFREEFAGGRSYEEALEAMLDTSGRAVIFSTATVALGFFVGVLSSFLPSVHFAVLTGAALLLGLACEAVLLPLTLIIFKPLGKVRPAAAAALLALVALLAAPPALAQEGPSLLLKDQHGRTDGPAAHRGRMVLLLVGQSSGLRKMKSWELKIIEGSGDHFDIVRVVDARGVRGRKTEAEVNARLRQGVPDEISILIDWNGEVARAYAMPAAEVVVTVLDPDGRSCGTTTGPVTPEGLRGLLKIVSHVKEKGSCP